MKKNGLYIIWMGHGLFFRIDILHIIQKVIKFLWKLIVVVDICKYNDVLK